MAPPKPERLICYDCGGLAGECPCLAHRLARKRRPPSQQRREATRFKLAVDALKLIAKQDEGYAAGTYARIILKELGIKDA